MFHTRTEITCEKFTNKRIEDEKKKKTLTRTKEKTKADEKIQTLICVFVKGRIIKHRMSALILD